MANAAKERWEPEDFDVAVDFDKHHLEKLKNELEALKIGNHVTVTGYIRAFAYVRRANQGY